ncbi:MAG: 2-oxoacid:acceptor oxidoreductase family protein [Candidatus Aramenus sp.]|nr:2-oxoacid:acceptor oxidoreductase family protein [Candidatus Aramenus sp.]
MLEIRFHGRGGQGVVTASNLLAEACGLDNLYSSAFPIYGAERRGAEIEAYCRISDSPIRVTSPVEEPDYVVVIDPSLLRISRAVFRGMKTTSKVVANYSGELQLKWRTFTINANKIATELGLVKSGWPMVNVVMLGALVRVMGIPSLEALKRAIEEEFEGRVAELNAKAVEVAYKEVKENYVLA